MGERSLSRQQFVRLGAAVGLGAAAVSVMAACEGGEAASNGSSATAAAEPTGSGLKVARREVIARESEVAANGALAFTDSETGQPAVLVRLPDGAFAAYSAVCTHQACTVAYEEQSGRLACPCHGAVFDPARGATVVSGPARRPLQAIGVEVRDGRVIRI